ncbi:hypothetical protein M3Y95_01034900 [Aphelenchoides besseyi]|nr:hypothetical protein M3Y95_01034900 [Aphelenchoides besseyi]
MDECHHLLEITDTWNIPDLKQYWPKNGEQKISDQIWFPFQPETKFCLTLQTDHQKDGWFQDPSSRVFISYDGPFSRDDFDCYLWYVAPISTTELGGEYVRGSKDKPIPINESIRGVPFGKSMEIYCKIVYKQPCPYCESESEKVSKITQQLENEVSSRRNQRDHLYKRLMSKILEWKTKAENEAELVMRLRIECQMLKNAITGKVASVEEVYQKNIEHLQQELNEWKSGKMEKKIETEKFTTLKIERDRLNGQLKETRNDRNRWKSKAKELENETQELKSQLTKKNSALDNERNSLAEMKSEIERLKSNLSAEVDKTKQMEDTFRKLKEVGHQLSSFSAQVNDLVDEWNRNP